MKQYPFVALNHFTLPFADACEMALLSLPYAIVNRRYLPLCRLDTPTPPAVPAPQERLRQDDYRNPRPATGLTAQLLWSSLLRRSKKRVDFKAELPDKPASVATAHGAFALP